MSDYDYISGPHTDAKTAARAVGEAGDCAIVRLHHVDGTVHAHVWEIDESALYLSGARAFLRAFAENMSHEPAATRGTTSYAMVIPPASVACLIDPAGTTTTVALGPQFQDDPVGRDEIYAGLRDVLTTDRESRVPLATRPFPPVPTADVSDASPRTADHGLLPPHDADMPYRIGPDGRPFPALDQIDPAATTPPAPPPSPPTEPVSDHRR